MPIMSPQRLWCYRISLYTATSQILISAYLAFLRHNILTYIIVGITGITLIFMAHRTVGAIYGQLSATTFILFLLYHVAHVKGIFQQIGFTGNIAEGHFAFDLHLVEVLTGLSVISLVSYTAQHILGKKAAETEKL